MQQSVFFKRFSTFKYTILMVVTGLLCSINIWAQTDTALQIHATDSIKIIHADSSSVAQKSPVVDTLKIPYPNPKRAGLLSSLIPGLGQVYNKQYWKLSIIYAGLGVSSYFIYDNAKNYNIYRKAYIDRIDGDPSTIDPFEEPYPYPDALRQKQEYYKKYLDMSVLITGVGYVLQILDAVTYAYLKDFDVSKDISLKAQPQLQIQPGMSAAPSLGYGIQLAFNLK